MYCELAQCLWESQTSSTGLETVSPWDHRVNKTARLSGCTQQLSQEGKRGDNLITEPCMAPS